MKKLIDILIPIAIIAVCVAMSAIATRCDRHETIESQQEVIEREREVIDSIKSLEEQSQRKIDSLISRTDTMVEVRTDIVYRYRTIRETTTDTILAIRCDSIIEIDSMIISEQEETITEQDHSISFLRRECDSYESALNASNDIIKAQTATITKLTPNWWDRNKFWVGVAAGAVIGGVGVWSVSRY